MQKTLIDYPLEYKIVVAHDRFLEVCFVKLEALVNEQIEHRWRPQGGIVSHDTTYVVKGSVDEVFLGQAMIRWKDTDSNPTPA